MKSLLISGRCPYNLHQENSLREAGVDAEIYQDWGIYLPDHVEAILAAKPDIIHLQWPESICAHRHLPDEQVIAGIADALPRLRASGAPIFWTMHNRLPHDRGKESYWRKIYQLFADHCDVCCHHSIWGQDQVLATYDFPHARHVLLRHGYFHDDIFPAIEKLTARERLNLPADACIYLNVGSLRPDKQISELLDCFAGRKTEMLVLAGSAGSEYAQTQIKRAEFMDNVEIHAGYTDDEMVCLLANAADSFLFMQGDNHLTSGGPHLSQAHLLPQLTLDYPYAREVLGDAALYIPADENRFERLNAVLDTLDPSTLNSCRVAMKEHRRLWHWSVIAAETKQAYERALAAMPAK